MVLTPTQKKAVEMYQKGASFRSIGTYTNLRAEEVLRLVGQVKAEQREKKGPCAKCQWRRDGLNSCVLPRCFLKSIGSVV